MRKKQTTALPVGNLDDVAVEKRSEREIPQAWRDSIAEKLEEWIKKQPKTKKGKAPPERALAPLLGISSFSLNRLRLKKGPLGLHVLVALTGPLEATLDELLGIPLTPAAMRRILREELAAHDEAKGGAAKKPPRR